MGQREIQYRGEQGSHYSTWSYTEIKYGRRCSWCSSGDVYGNNNMSVFSLWLRMEHFAALSEFIATEKVIVLHR